MHPGKDFRALALSRAANRAGRLAEHRGKFRDGAGVVDDPGFDFPPREQFQFVSVFPHFVFVALLSALRIDTIHNAYSLATIIYKIRKLFFATFQNTFFI